MSEGEKNEQVALRILLSGTAAEIDRAARTVVAALERSGVRYVVERRRPEEEELELFPGEHRSL